MAGGISRRAFVGSAAIAGTLAAVPVLGAVPALGAVSPARSAWARSRFTPFVGATFRMTDGHDAVDVVLTEVADLDPVQRAGDEKRFALLFAAAHDHPEADGIRTFRRAGFGEIDMFVSPAGRRTRPFRYQVIVNRL